MSRHIPPLLVAFDSTLGQGCVRARRTEDAAPRNQPASKTPTHAWFAGFAPYRKPTIALAVIIEYGGGGGATAGPVAKSIFELILDSPRGYLSKPVATDAAVTLSGDAD